MSVMKLMLTYGIICIVYLIILYDGGNGEWYWSILVIGIITMLIGFGIGFYIYNNTWGEVLAVNAVGKKMTVPQAWTLLQYIKSRIEFIKWKTAL